MVEVMLSRVHPSPAHPTSLDQNPDFLHIEDQISHCQRSLATLKAQRNTFLPAVRLLPEVLAQVFRWCQVIAYQDEFDLNISGKTFPYPWITVTQVCRRWREVALDTVGLWTTLRIRHPDQAQHPLTQLVLARSKAALLDIDVQSSSSYNDSDSLLRIALPHLERARSITFKVSPSSLDNLRHELPTSLPLLTVLNVSMPGGPVYDCSTTLPDTVAPGLNSLIIKGYIIPWSTRDFPPTLTHLEIIRNWRPKRGSTVGEVVQALSELKSLRQLVLQKVFAVHTVADAEPTTHAVLKHLEKLEVYDIAPITAAYLLDSLDVSSSTRILLYLSYHERLTPDIMPRLLPSLVAKVPAAAPIDTLIQHKSSIFMSNSASTWFCVEWTWPSDTEEDSTVMLLRDVSAQLLSASGCATKITTLVVHSLLFLDANRAAWKTLLQLTPNVETLGFHSYSVPQASSAAKILKVCSGSDAWLPKVKNLAFDDFSFRQNNCCVPGRPSFLETLCSAVAAAKIEEIQIRRCRAHMIDEYMVEHLKSVVGRVVWDVEDEKTFCSCF
ncbi:hypothetical protein EIP91_009361 [Steccherinum ochraceum]|uniref:F-box domain-containing protein n=1 Tax=Steccherinum ochraceum TaxID=92696 RepID=A0A4R0RKG2_9APHY|nr:hypothetical protein EIP91_009361 [Steccherinum ochraceum]